MVAFCPRTSATGACTELDCSYRHDVRICELCAVICTSENVYRAHLAGKKHRDTLAGKFATFHCAVCDRDIPGSNWVSHLAGKPHKKEATRQAVGPESIQPQPAVGIAPPGHFFCAVCSAIVMDSRREYHTRSSSHLKKEKYASYKAILDEAEKDKNGVTVEGTFDFGVVNEADASSGREKSDCVIRTTIPSARITVVEFKLASTRDRRSSPFSIRAETGITITHGKPATFTVNLRQVHVGRSDDRLEVVLEDVQLGARFVIARTLRATVGDKTDYERFRPKAPYVPRERAARPPPKTIVTGEQPPSLKAVPYVVPLPKATIPAGLAANLDNGSVSEISGRIRRMFLPPVLDSTSYARHFKALLWVEEHRMELDLAMYDMSNANLTKHNSYFYLGVPGLAEKRPSVLAGDTVLVQKDGAPQGHWFAGSVYFVRREEIGLRFHESFRGWSPAQAYNVRFCLNRIPVKRQHQALDSAFSQDRVLFPRDAHLQTPGIPTLKGDPLDVINPLIATNPPQLQAVRSIVAKKAGDPPFIIFGPPGTGKTVTMVEAMLQILRRVRTARILACAPSNSAADLLATRLAAELGTTELFRFYAPSRDKGQIPDALLRYTLVRPDGVLSIPPVPVLKRFRAIVTTCVSSSFAAGVGVPRGHYTHIFVDEAGQATEPETMVALKTLCGPATNVVLSGDPKQLGPVIRSGVARALGMEMSYLERLMAREFYSESTGHGISLVKLVRNFRSNPAILRFPNERFYGGDLQACAAPEVADVYIGSPLLPARRFPVIFHALAGRDDREAASPSFFNIGEITQVRKYVQQLRNDRRTRITDHDIGIITPYHAQCVRMRNALRGIADDVKVGSVEEFQGQERRVIIISAVRSSPDFVEYDLRHTLGFVAHPRRFNVAVTRAQALLIVVGDPAVLGLDPLWRAFLNYVHIGGGWVGPPIQWDPRAEVPEANGGYDKATRDAAAADMNELARRMEEMALAAAGGAEDAGAHIDRPWREVE